MAKLINAEFLNGELCKLRYAGWDPIEEFHNLIAEQPEYNPWRKIDDVDGLKKGEEVLLISKAHKSVGWFDGTSLMMFVLYGYDRTDKKAECGYTHYMVIPEPPKVGE